MTNVAVVVTTFVVCGGVAEVSVAAVAMAAMAEVVVVTVMVAVAASLVVIVVIVVVLEYLSASSGWWIWPLCAVAEPRACRDRSVTTNCH